MKWRRYTLRQTPERPLLVFGETIDYSITPSSVIATIWRFLSGQSRAPRHEHPNEYVCLGLVLTRQTKPRLTLERAMNEDLESLTDPNNDVWDYWHPLDDSAIVHYGLVVRWMVSTCVDSLSDTHEVFMGYHDETNELIQLRIRYYDTQGQAEESVTRNTKELVIIKHNNRIFPNERGLFENPLTTDLGSHSEYLWESFNSRVSDIPNIRDQYQHANVSYMMPYEEE